MKSIRITKSEKFAWNYIKGYYGLGFLAPGQIVKSKPDEKLGTVIGVDHSYLLVYFQNGKTGCYHPDSLRYLDMDGKVIR